MHIYIMMLLYSFYLFSCERLGKFWLSRWLISNWLYYIPLRHLESHIKSAKNISSTWYLLINFLQLAYLWKLTFRLFMIKLFWFANFDITTIKYISSKVINLILTIVFQFNKHWTKRHKSVVNTFLLGK